MLNRRHALLVAALAAMLPLGTGAQAFPDKEIRLICTFPPGSGADILVRFFAERLKPLVNGQTIIVENKPGAAGSIGAQYVSRRPPDGYTIVMDAGTTWASIPSRFKRPPIDVVKNLQMVATVNRQAFMIVVPQSSPFKTLQELTAHLKAEGDKATYAATANSGIVLGEVYKARAGLQTVQVKYESAPDAFNDLMSGRLAFGAVDPVFAMAQLREKRMRVLAVASNERLAAVPDLPTLKENGLDVDITNWWAVAMPAGTPPQIVNQVNAWYNEILKQPETVEFLKRSGGDPLISTPAETEQRLIKSIDEWRDYIRIANIPPAG